MVRSIAIALVVLTGCSTIVPDDALPSTLQTYSAGDIVTAGDRRVRLESIEGCLYLTDSERRHTAFFPVGSSLTQDGLGVRLPDGTTLRLGSTYELLLEFYPVLRNENPACTGPNAFVRSIVPDGE